MIDSHHMDSVVKYPNALSESEGHFADEDIPKAQDLHAMLDVILQSYVDLQNSGFIWDLMYRNRLYKNIEFVLFTPFFRTDSDEAEKLCGKYTSRTANVKQLCRYCYCPTDQTDEPFAQFPAKNTAEIMRKVRKNDLVALKNMSQHCIKNSMYKLRFGCHNEQGIHGACPMDMLHAILLGVFHYVRDSECGVLCVVVMFACQSTCLIR